jgi:hypothetical protein
MDSLTEKSMAFSPVLVGDSDEVKIAITESDLEDYPGMFLRGTNRKRLCRCIFAPYPLEEKMTKGEFPPGCLLQKSGLHCKDDRAPKFSMAEY